MMKTIRITSLQNPRIKLAAKLRSDARQRRKDGLMLVEGWDEINLALAAGHKPRTILHVSDLSQRPFPTERAELLELSPSVFERLSFRENPDGWMAVFPVPESSLQELKLGADPLLLVVEALEKPGNLGAILRTCDAAGVDGVIVCDPKADLYGPNVVRASRGTVFTVPVVAATSSDALEFLRRHGVRVAAASPAGRVEYTAESLRGPLAVAVGTEDEGLSDLWLKQADVLLQIPMRGKINSLNVSVAAGLLIYEARRQRSG